MNCGPAITSIEIQQFITRPIFYFSYFHVVVNRNYICWMKLKEGESSLPLFFLMNLAQDKISNCMLTENITWHPEGPKDVINIIISVSVLHGNTVRLRGGKNPIH